MTPNAMHRLVASQASVLAPRMYEGVSSALAAAAVRAKGLEHEEFPHLRPMLARAELRQYLKAEGLPPQWTLDGNPRSMGQLYLSAPDLALRLRFLKERRKSYPGGVPVAGKNRARQEAWNQLALPMPEVDRTAAAKTQDLLLLWDFANKQSIAEGFTLRIVRPLAPGVYGKPVPYDINITLKAGGNIFTNMSFAGDPETEDFFGDAHIDRAENDE